jgi:hypothetical protein
MGDLHREAHKKVLSKNRYNQIPIFHATSEKSCHDVQAPDIFEHPSVQFFSNNHPLSRSKPNREIAIKTGTGPPVTKR